MVIPRTNADTIDEGFQLLSRLGRHLSAIEQGEPGSGDDLAAVLRILLDRTNPGNRGMSRLAAALKVPLPPVFASGSPMLTGDGLLLSFGNLPLVPAPGDGQPHTPRWLTFDAWANTDSLIVPSSQKKRESWGTFTTLIANTDGSHLSTVYHDFLETSDLFETVGLSLQDFLLRQVGWQVEQVLAQLLARAGRSLLPRTRRVDHWSRMPIWMHFLDRPGVGMEASVSVNVTNDDPRPVEIMRFSWRGKTSRMFHDGGATPRVRIVIEDPETGEKTTTLGTSMKPDIAKPGPLT
jgi:hypothetical protein